MSSDTDALHLRLLKLEAEIHDLRSHLAAQQHTSGCEGATRRLSGRQAQGGGDGRAALSRRALLLGGTAAAISGVASLAHASPAAATTGTMIYGAFNDAGSSNTALQSTNISSTLGVTNTRTGGGTGEPAYAIRAVATNASGAALAATGLGTTGVLAVSTGARSIVAGAVYGRGGDNCGLVGISETGAPLRLGNAVLATVPTTGTWTVGDFVQVNGALWFCVASGTPGSWRLLASPAGAGAFVPITPARVYDSRFNSSVDSGVGPLTSGGTRLVSVAKAYTPNTNTVAIDNVVPAGARAVSINLTITGPTGSGYLFIAPGIATTTSGSSINWPSANITLANGLTVGLDTARRLKAFLQISGGMGSCHFLVDVNGYFLGH